MSLPPTSVPANFSQNMTNGSSCQRSTEQWVYTVMVVYVLVIAVLGIVFNLFVLLVFCLHKKPCTVAEIYLSNLAAADLILLSFLPFWAVSIYKGLYWPFGDAMCKLVNLSIHMNIYSSIYFLVLVSIDRFMALVQPLSHERLRRPKYAKLGCLLVWCWGLILCAPTLVYREVSLFNYNNSLKNVCALNYPNMKVTLLCEGILPVFGFIIPIPIISYCTWKIVGALNQRFTELSSSQKMEHKATTLIMVVLLTFLICWVPFHIVKMIELLVRAKVFTGCALEDVVVMCRQIFTYLAFFNSVLNPILYVIVGKTFRKKVREVFHPSAERKTLTTSSFNSTRTFPLKSFRSESGRR
ncbi:hypothetical protein Q5P01_020130 [Channa striata]|uniref:G-protein coupled receptors family 1 profile domain-containing protein n=1 Tax=Channa striata TaxID=64152 RepID=A0AA88LWZ0_CHASR|nr:hypothetical protein Q5P01_020130 [Channa striata]